MDKYSSKCVYIHFTQTMYLLYMYVRVQQYYISFRGYEFHTFKPGLDVFMSISMENISLYEIIYQKS